MDDPNTISRRGFLSTIGSTVAASCLPLSEATALLGRSAPAHAQPYSQIRKSGESTAQHPVLVINSGYRLLLDGTKGTIASLQSTYGVDRELLISTHNRLPLFKIELMSPKGEFSTVTSSDAHEVTMRKSESENEQIIVAEYKGIGGLPIEALVTIRCPVNKTLTYWKLKVTTGVKSWIAHVQFPVIQVPFDDRLNGDPNKILSSTADGSLAGPVEPSMSLEQLAESPQNTPEIWRYGNYPGQFASTQLMAYYNSAGGLYLACDDATGLPKFIRPLLEEDGVTMGLGHYPGICGPGETTLPYNVVVGTFHGDWYAAAEIYRDWAMKQSFCRTKLVDRKDCPRWITESPVGIMFPMRGQADWDRPAVANPEYTPLTNAIPYLDKVARELGSSLMPIVFNWEHGGPWVQPQAFPPVGGDAAMREFMATARKKGWHPVVYGDGLCWVTWQKNTDYDGLEYFRTRNGEAIATRKWDGSLLEWVWPWRKNYFACVGTAGGRQMVVDMTRKISEFGPAVIQQFDQGPGPIACYSADHGHPPVPGPWMTEAFNVLLKADIEAARSVNPSVAMSCEGPPPEIWLQEFQIWDARISNCPLFAFLYHEYAAGQEGLYTNRINDETLRLSVARALVTGYIMNFTLRDKGLIAYDWDQPWTRAIPDQSAISDWATRINEFRRGLAKEYLVFGRMLRPWKVSNVAERDFGWGKESGIQSATWQASDGRIGVVLANYADLGQSPRVQLEGKGTRQIMLYIDGKNTTRLAALPCAVDIDMLPRSLCLIQVT
jgi:hypothetical protein